MAVKITVDQLTRM